MKKPILLLGLTVLTNCVAAAPDTFDMTGVTTATNPLPPEVVSDVPADLGLADILVRDGCYFKRINGVIEPIMVPTTGNNGIVEQPYCIG